MGSMYCRVETGMLIIEDNTRGCYLIKKILNKLFMYVFFLVKWLL